MNDSIKFINNYCDFSNPNWVWIMKGIVRNKDNNSNVKFMHRMILTSPDDIQPCYNDIHNAAIEPATYRIYISLNARDIVKSTFSFQKKLLDISYGLARGLDDHLGMSKKIGSLWKTELEQRSNRGTKRFLLDIDEKLDEEKILAIVAYLNQTLKTTVHCMRRTVNGWAIVFNACDTRGLMSYCKEIGIRIDDNTLQRDSMVFVERFEGN